MTRQTIYLILHYVIAAVWIINGLFCKVLHLVPRHEQIVSAILGAVHAGILTKMIGLAEIGMAVWILSGYKTRLNALAQIGIVATMNILEFTLVPDLLLWGRFNAMFALLFIVVVYCNEFRFKNA